MTNAFQAAIVDPSGLIRIQHLTANQPNVISTALGIEYFSAWTADRFAAYFDEEQFGYGPADLNRVSSLILNDNNGIMVFGKVAWFGRCGSVETDIPDELIQMLMILVGNLFITEERPITVVQHGLSYWVFDQPLGITETVTKCARDCDALKGQSVIVVPGLDRGTWQETRVDLMDHPGIDLHDMRTDRSYG